MIYGLTKGQASPTSRLGFKTPVQVNGVILEPFNPVAVAIALGASFVARTSAGDQDHAREIFKQAIQHKGYALVDIFQPCVTFNKLNTYQWFKEHTYYLTEEYNPEDKSAAFDKSQETEEFPLGVLYINKQKSSFEENLNVYREDSTPVVFRDSDYSRKLNELIESKK